MQTRKPGPSCSASSPSPVPSSGGAFAFLGVLLTSPSQSRVVGWTAGVSMTAAAGMVVCVLGWTLGASVVAIEAAKAAAPDALRVPDTFLRIHLYLSQVFIFSLLLFLCDLGLSGWVRSRALGIVSTGYTQASTVVRPQPSTKPGQFSRGLRRLS